MSVLSVWVIWPQAVLAHPAEQGLVLLLPTALYNWGGTWTVVGSILLMSLISHRWLARIYRGVALGRGGDPGRWPQVCSILAALAVLALIHTGFAGPSDPQRNLLPLTIWTGWWIGVFMLQALVLDLWRWLNPWTGLYALLFGGSEVVLRLPAWLGAWPAVAVFVGFQGFMLADIAPSDPGRLATVVLAYWVFTFVGMAVFGDKAWLRQVECFSVLFALIGALRMVQVTDRIRVGLPGWASLQLAPLDGARAVFCLVILASGSFDGLSETFWWLGVIGINPLEFPGRSAVIGSTLIGLVAANAALIAVFALAVWGGIRLVRRRKDERPAIPFGPAFRSFAIAILPIGLGYHLAHYLVTFLVQSQYLVAALGDPLAAGWNLFGLGSVTVTTGFLNSLQTVRPILLAKVAVVVVSHVLSVAAAHALAGRFVTTRRCSVLLQGPLGILMIFYTFFGLWLLSTPRGA